ncbi:hypothetical protein ACJIZ3_021585 [Penstemon smallii]|uniref:Arginine decarboxylase n=1 Tax=Penstemon smallii TaxID=265156 RepID=A0ABD3SMD8_9LAMI
MDSSLNFGKNWSLSLNKIPRACISQESCHLILGKNQEHKGHSEILELDTKDKVILKYPQKFKNYRPPPLVSALKDSAAESAASFHFPGHNRGAAAPESLTELIGTRPFQHDLPELPELDNLFAPEGPILEAQKEAANLFGASETWFLVGGSTCGVQAAIMATCSPGDTLVLPRNSHISAVSTMVLCGAVPNDINAISKICHSRKIPLIVDEAHGGHFGFHKQLPISALAQGADLVVQSTHKVLCSLTQSSMLHSSGNSLVDRERICQCLQTLQSSSPSYLLLASLGAARAQISDNQETIFNEAIELAIEAKSMIDKIPGISLLGSLNFPSIDPLRVTIGVWGLGLSGFEADDILCRDFGVVSELVGTQSITLAFNLGTRREHVLRLVEGLNYLSATLFPICTVNRMIEVTNLVHFDDIEMILSPRDAFFALKRKVRIEESIGEICGELICPYPPGIPVLFPGEVITERAVEYLLRVKGQGAVISGAVDCLLSSLVVCKKS